MKSLVAAIGVLVGSASILAGCAEFTNSDVGKEEYQANCAACHGSSGKGDGPQAEMLATKPADLSMLAKKNGGEFPDSRVYEMIDGRLMVAAHGSREMPVWGDEFQLEETRSPRDDSTQGFSEREARVNARIKALVDYLKGLQQ